MAFDSDRTIEEKCKNAICRGEEVFANLQSLSQSVGLEKSKSYTIDCLENLLVELDGLRPSPSGRKAKKDATSFIMHLCRKAERFDDQNPSKKSKSDEVLTSTAAPQPPPAAAPDSECPTSGDDSDSCDEDDLDHRDDLDHDIWQKDFLNNARADRTQCPRLKYKKSPTHNIMTWLLITVLLWKAIFFITDNATNSLLSMLAVVFHYIDLQAVNIGSLSGFFPSSFSASKKWLGLEDDNFERFCVCSTCYALYDITDLLYVHNNKTFAKECNNQVGVGKRTKVCGNKLLQMTVLRDGTRKFLPIKSYCYRPIISSIECLLQRPAFENKCASWKQRHVADNNLGDIYDGEVWKEFKCNGENFFNANNNYGLMLNVDWFQPFKRRNDISIGVIYMTILNLPRIERFKDENVILVGIIPALKHEPEKLDTFLKPLIDELKLLWRGCQMLTHNFPNGVQVKAALLCSSADIPASRKLCGFLSHSARLGCNKCYSSFSGGFGEKRDYSGFHTQQWKPRTHKEHKSHINEIKKCSTKTEVNKTCSKYGVRYTPLLELEYYDAIRHNVIDPMHCLFLGIAKTMWRIWTAKEVVTTGHFELINSRLVQLNSSQGCEQIPHNISANSGNWTAHEWKVWTLSCSVYCLHDILDTNQMLCWQKFVKACQHICKPTLTLDDVKISHLLLVSFCKKVEELFGCDKITPNMHLSCHLDKCILDFGPIYSFWLFSFERYNGIMANINTNKLGLEIQLMRKFLQKSSLINLFPQLPKLDDDKFQNLLCDLNKTKYLCVNDDINLPEVYKIKMFDEDDLNLLVQSYQRMFPNDHVNMFDQCLSYKKFNSLTVGNNCLQSLAINKNPLKTIVMAQWLDETERPCVIKFFIQHCFNKDNEKPFIFAVVNWFQMIGDEQTLDPFQKWDTFYECSSYATFVPVDKIKSRVVYVKQEPGNILICPLQEKVYC